MEEKNKETININLKTSIILIIATIIIMAGIVCVYTYFLTNNNKEIKEESTTNNIVNENIVVPDPELEAENINSVDNNTEKDNINNVENETKEQVIDYTNEDIVYNAKYEKNTSKNTYKDLGGEKYSIDDIVVPYIDIDSEDAKKINNEIEKVNNKLIEKFEDFANEDETMGYVKANYKSYVNDNILSILITVEEGDTYLPIYTYYTYNFDLTTSKLYNYTDVCKKFSYTEENIKNKLKESIGKQEELVGLDEDTKLKSINKSIKYYEELVKDNTIKYYLDDNEKLNNEVKIENEEISPSTFLKVINV